MLQTFYHIFSEVMSDMPIGLKTRIQQEALDTVNRTVEEYRLVPKTAMALPKESSIFRCVLASL